MNYLYLYLYSEWAGSNPEVGRVYRTAWALSLRSMVLRDHFQNQWKSPILQKSSWSLVEDDLHHQMQYWSQWGKGGCYCHCFHCHWFDPHCPARLSKLWLVVQCQLKYSLYHSLFCITDYERERERERERGEGGEREWECVCVWLNL